MRNPNFLYSAARRMFGLHKWQMTAGVLSGLTGENLLLPVFHRHSTRMSVCAPDIRDVRGGVDQRSWAIVSVGRSWGFNTVFMLGL